MTTTYEPGFRKRIGAERAMLMLPMNVVMVGRISGVVGSAELTRAVTALRTRHALLAVRVVFDTDAVAWLETDGVPETPVRGVPAADEDEWQRVVTSEIRTPFPLETGPLVRVSLVAGPEHSDLIVTGQHVVCDGVSLTYLLRDILEQLAAPDREVEVLPPPPPIDETTVPEPKKKSVVARWIMNLISWKWRRQDIAFDQQALERMHATFWERNGAPLVLRWSLSPADTQALVERCRHEEVTVNSALWAAFLVAQQEVQSDEEAFRRQAGLAVSTRDKLKVPVGEQLGFFASSLNLGLPELDGVDFWEAARQVHRDISGELKQTDIFRMLEAESLPPTLLDALYFAKYDGLESGLARKMLKKLTWDRTSYGYAITNVGRVDIPTEYGERTLEAVYGPLLFSDVNEKVIGVTTVGGTLTFALTCDRDKVDEATATRLRGQTEQTLRDALA